MNRILYLLMVVAIGWVVTFSLRALPFMLFAGRDRELPKWVERFGGIVSPIIIAGLIVYSYTGLEWKSPWPYLAGALTVGLQLWRRNPLVSIIAGTVLYMFLIAGCATSSYGEIGLDAARPSIRYSVGGLLIGSRYVEPSEIPEILESYEVPHDRVIHIHVDAAAMADLRPARSVMGMLAMAGYTRSVLVTDKKAESKVVGQ